MVYEEASVVELRKRGTGSNLVDMGRDARPTPVACALNLIFHH